MSLTETNLYRIATKQYIYKLKEHYGVLSTMAITQLLALLFSLGGTSSSGFGTAGLSVNISYYTGLTIIIFTLVWAFIISMQLTSSNNRDSDFAFVSNRKSSNLSNSMFLLTISIIGGISVMLSGILLRVITYFFFDNSTLLSSHFLYSPLEFLTGIAATALYVLLFSSLGYFMGMLTQLNKLFIMILPVILIGIFTIQANSQNQNSFMIKSIKFIGQESSLSIFALKIFTIIGLIWLVTLYMSNRMEVRR